MIEALRTPEARFESLPGWPYAPLYVDDLPGFEGLRMHYADEGPRGAPVFLCIHGEPSWAYLFRRMIPVFLTAGGRVVAPNFFGFGRSDKPVDDAQYTALWHRDALRALIARLDLQNITLVVQDWGGLIGLTLPHADPDRYKRLIVMNTMLGLGEELTDGFKNWRAFVASRPDLGVGDLFKRACPHLSEAEAAAYDAPFPDARFKAGVRRFPQLVPTTPDDPFAKLSRDARAFWRERWAGQSFMAIGEADPVLAPVMPALHADIRHCPAPLLIPEAGHFVQEWGEPVARAALASFA